MSKWLESWKSYTPDKFPKKRRRRVTTDTERKKGKISGEYCQKHEAKEKWKHINERPH